jgi:hypothetical protein
LGLALGFDWGSGLFTTCGVKELWSLGHVFCVETTRVKESEWKHKMLLEAVVWNQHTIMSVHFLADTESHMESIINGAEAYTLPVLVC